MSTNDQITIWMRLRGQAQVVRGLKQVETATSRANRQLSRTGKHMDGVSKKKGTFRQSLTIMRKSLVGLTAASAAFAAVGLTSASLDFEDSMARVRATLTGTAGFSDKVFNQLSDATMHWAEISRFSSAEVADGLFKLVSNGFSAQQAMQALGGTTDLAGATMIDMATAANVQMNVLKQFGFQANKARYVADVLTTAVNEGSAEMGDLATSFRYIGPIAATFGTTFEQTASALEVMAQGGFRGAFSGRALRTGFVRLVSPTKAVNKGLKTMGLSLDDVQGPNGLKPLPKLLDILRGRLDKLPGAKGKQAVARIFGTEAVTQWLYLIRHSGKDMDKMQVAIGKNEGKARDFAKKMLATTRGSLEQFFNTISDLWTRLIVTYSPQIQKFFNGASKALNDLRDPSSNLRQQLEPLFSIFRSLFRVVKAIVIQVQPFAKLIGGAVLVGLIGVSKAMEVLTGNGTILNETVRLLIASFIVYKLLMLGQAGIVKGVYLMVYAWKKLNLVIKANPLIFWMSVGAAVVLLLIDLYQNCETFRNIVDATFNTIVDVGKYALDWLRNNWPLLIGILGGPFGIAIWAVWRYFGVIKNVFGQSKDFIINAWNIVMNFFKGLPGRFAAYGVAMGKALINGLVTLINMGITSINSGLAFSIPGVSIPGPFPDIPSVSVDPPDIPTIPYLAAGGTTNVATSAIVGERGPELATLPAGARVTPLRAPASLPLTNLASTGGNGGGDTRLVVELDGRVLAESVHRHVERRQHRR